MPRPIALSSPSKRLIMGAVGAVFLCSLLFYVVLLVFKEKIDVAVVPEGLGSALANQSKPVRLSSTQALRNVMLGLTQLREEQRQWQEKEGGERNTQFDELVKRMVDMKQAAKDTRIQLQKELQESRELLAGQESELEQQRKLLHRYSAEIKELQSMVEYQKAARKEKTVNYTLYTVTDALEEPWKQHTFRRHAAYGLITFSAYRTSPSRIAIIGLAARAQHTERRLSWCEWQGKDGSIIKGGLSMLYGGEHHNYIYETIVLNCDLTENIKQSGGSLMAKIDSELMFLYAESKDAPLDAPAGPFEYERAYCGAPMFGKIEPKVVIDFMAYNRAYVGIDHFVLYDAGALDQGIMEAIDAFVRTGLVTIVDYRDSNMWDTWVWGQQLCIHDCAYRMRPLAKWVFIHDLDEYVEVVPPHTLSGILDKFQDRPWITHGCLVFGIHNCDKDESPEVSKKFLVAPMMFRWPHIYCQDNEVTDRNFCLDHPGHRKFIMNPRKTRLYQMHVVLESEGDGVDLTVELIRHCHFQGLSKRGEELCEKGSPTDWWFKYDGITRLTEAVLKCPRDPATQLCEVGSVKLEKASDPVPLEQPTQVEKKEEQTEASNLDPKQP